MENKKKYIIAIVLFIFLGLMVFTFANPSDEDEGKKLDGNGTEEKENSTDDEKDNTDSDDINNTGDNTEANNNNNANTIYNNNNPVAMADNSYDEALKAVINAEAKVEEDSYNTAADLVDKVTNNDQKEELLERLEEVKDGIDAKALVEELANKVEASYYDENDMSDARDFREDEEIVSKVNDLTNEDLKEELLEQLTTLALLLDDKTDPTLNIKDGDVLSSATEILVENDEEFIIEIKEEGSTDSTEVPNGYTVGEGTFTLTVIEKSGRKTAVTFTVDLSEPLFNVTSGTHSTDSIDVVITDATFKYVEIYNQDANTKELSTNGEFTLTEEATYKLTAYDEAGNSKVVWVAIDKTNPTITGVDNNVHYNDKELTVTIEDKFLMNLIITGPNGVEEFTRKDFTVGKNNEDFSLVYTATAEGTYTIEATDKVGNPTTVTFTIDRTKPVITDVVDGGYYQSVTPGVIEENFKNATLKLNGKHIKSYKVGDTLTEEGTYTLVVTDKAMNKSNNGVITFVVDHSINVPTISYSTTEPTNKMVTVTLTADEEVEVLNAGTWNPASGFNTVFKKAYPANTTQVVTVRDRAGNETTVEVVIANIDKVAPTATNVEIKGITKTPGYAKVGDEIWVGIITNEELGKVPTITINGVVGEKVQEEINSAGHIYYAKVIMTEEMAEGEIQFTIEGYEDLAGNEGKKLTNADINLGLDKIVLDKTAPTAEVIKSNNDKSTNQDVIVTIKTSEVIITPEEWTEVVEGTEFTKVYSENGKYSVVITDLAGNEKEVKFEVKRIDKVAPEATVTMSNNNGLTSTNKDVTVTLTANEAIYRPEGWTEVATNKEKEWTKVYSENGKYSVVITDKAGNQTTVNFEVKRIDKVAPVVTVIDPNRYQIEVGSEYVDKGYSAWDEVDKDVTHLIKITYQFQAKGTNAWPFVDSLDTNKLGTYKVIYTAYDKAGNTAVGTRVVQVVDTILPTVEAHSLVGKDPYYSQISFKLHDNHLVDKFTINGDEYDRTDNAWSDANYQNIKSSLKDGENVFVLYDVYGNKTEYKFTLDLVAPTITIKDTVNAYVLNQPSFALSDNNLIDKFTVNGKEHDRTDSKWSDANYGNIKSDLVEGENTIVLYDAAGNSTSLTFINVVNGKANVTDDITLVDRPFYNVVDSAEVTINGNGKTVTQAVTSEEKFNWIDGIRTTMGNMFASKNGEKITINDLTFAGTTQSLSLGQYRGSTYNKYNTELNNVNVIDLEVVSLSPNVSPAVIVFGSATLNNTNIYGTKLSNLDTSPRWPVYDLALVNFTTTTINGGKIGSIVTWNQMSLYLNNTKVDSILTSAFNKDGIVVNSGTTVNLIDVEDVGDASRVVPYAPKITINSGATVNTLDLRGAKDYSKVIIKDGATVNKIITEAKEMTLDEWKEANK